MEQGEAYLDIVWRQFKKNKSALISLWMLVPLFLIAIFAPAIASNQPLVFYDGDQRLFPWLRWLFNPAEPIDFVFNMMMLGSVPWMFWQGVANYLRKRRGMPGRRRLGWAIVELFIITAILTAVFSHPDVRPKNKYKTRTFAEEQHQSGDTKSGVYVLIPLGPLEQDIEAHNKPPIFIRENAQEWTESNDGFPHVLGTDDTGRDVLVQMIYGTRISMTIGFLAVGLYVTIGVIIGATAGYFGGKIDMFISRIIEIVLLFPSFFLILTLVALIGPSIYIIMFVIGITSWPSIARLIRGEVLRQRAIEYTDAARALGVSHFRVIFRHILPNALSPALVAAPFGIANAIIIEAGLSLLGFGVRPPTPSWGTLLLLGSSNYSYWWFIVFPSIAIFVTVTVFNLIGSGLRDAMDPRLRA